MKAARELLAITLILVLAPSVIFAQCNAKCLVGASANAGGDLLALFWSPPSASLTNLEVHNVSRITEHRVVGPVTRWQVPDGPFTVEHLAGVSPSGDLLVFFWSTAPEAKWQVVNVSRLTSRNPIPEHQVVGPVTNWQGQDGPFTVEYLAGVSPSGDLLVFFWSPQADWQVANVSAITGQQVATIWADITGQQMDNVSVITGQQVVGPVTNQVYGQQVVGPVTSWLGSQKDLLFVQRLAGVSPSGDLLVFFRTFSEDWQVVNVSRLTGQQVVGPVTSWVIFNGPTGPAFEFGLDHLVATGLNNEVLYVFWNLGFGRQPNPGWGFCDISQASCTNLLFANGR